MAVRGFRGVRDDLSELGRHLLDIACFISPAAAAAAAYNDSPPPSPRPLRLPRRRPPSPRPPSARVLAGILSDLAEIGGGFRAGLSILAAVFRSADHEYGERERELIEIDDRPRGEVVEKLVVGISQDVLDFVGDLVKCPESWLEFPVVVDGDFIMSQAQQEHINAVECLAPDLAALRVSICPSYMNVKSFWRIYFALLHPRLSIHDSELLSTNQILDSMRATLKDMQSRRATNSHSQSSVSLISLLSEKGSVVRREEDQARRDHMTTRTRSQQSIDQWSEVPSNIDGDGISQFVSEDTSFRNINNGNLLLMEKYMDSIFGEASSVDSCSSRQKQNKVTSRNVPLAKMSSDDESGNWQAIEDSSDFEVVDKP